MGRSGELSRGKARQRWQARGMRPDLRADVVRIILEGVSDRVGQFRVPSLSVIYLRKIACRSSFVSLNINPVLSNVAFRQRRKELEQATRLSTERCLRPTFYSIGCAEAKWVNTRDQGTNVGIARNTATTTRRKTTTTIRRRQKGNNTRHQE